ncbi:MAG: ATP-binding protein [Deltaproteobacteria bacterium]|jgi:hypothetical protein|nr:ATP-binding protein [Deltaproteobacteria bacterium]
MGHKIEHPPGAAALSSSMRDIGYSLDTAIADLIDNSISACAGMVDVHFREINGENIIAVVDDGIGMDEASLQQAMRLGSSVKDNRRRSSDLGKFGLGLKTATYSQCRMLTVASRQDGKIVAVTQDLDEIDRTDKWLLTLHNGMEIAKIPLLDCLPKSGTLVLWRKLDRLDAKAVSAEIAALEHHLSLVFHRFLDGEATGKKLEIKINGKQVECFDPFCRKYQATQHFAPEYVAIAGARVKITPFVLPHYTKLTKSEYSFYNKISNFYDNQGIYVYRNKRLLIWGTWLSTASRSEITKLARIQVDFSSDQDDYWVIDIKKSKTRLHVDVRKQLSRLLPGVLESSSRIFKRRGQAIAEVNPDKSHTIWERRAASGKVFFDLNRNHPLLQKVLTALDGTDRQLFKNYLDAVVRQLPVNLIYSEFSSDPNSIETGVEPDDVLLNKLNELYHAVCIESGCGWNDFLSMVKIIPGLSGRDDLLSKISKEA